MVEPHDSMGVVAPISPGELCDKITILEIKAERIADGEKLRNVRVELAALQASKSRELPGVPDVVGLVRELKTVNEALWETEDAIRACEAAKDFGHRFIELARSVYRQNDRRAALKRQINEVYGSRLVEEKAYTPY